MRLSCATTWCDGLAGSGVFGFQGHGERTGFQARCKGAVDAIGQSPVDPDVVHQPGGKAPAPQDVIHHLQGVKIRILTGDPQVAQDDVGLADIFVDHHLVALGQGGNGRAA